MKNVLIVGASGMVGNVVLRACLEASEIKKITSITRRSSGINHPKLNEVIHQNFLDFSGLEVHFRNQDIAQFCIGVYTGAVPEHQLKTITVDMTKAFADALVAGSPKATFCFLSGSGADPSEKSRIAFARYKGITENYLVAKNFGQLFVFRPAYIYPVEKRKEPNWMYRISRRLYPVLKILFPKSAITSVRLGQAMCKAGIEGAPKMILENEDIKKV